MVNYNIIKLKSSKLFLSYYFSVGFVNIITYIDNYAFKI